MYLTRSEAKGYLHSRVERYRSVFIWVTLPICNRTAIQATVIRVSFLNGTARSKIPTNASNPQAVRYLKSVMGDQKSDG